ncbi:MAG: right-handed parallel beta-helix repeat-containing protein, partial [Eubacteriales bacterium]|nr:right-handed parallel beta-helix repeat-containing protein [Eubacteriales bacterium]
VRPDAAVIERLRGEARNEVVCCNLRDYGLTPGDWGKIYAAGAFHTAAKYDGDTQGVSCELFMNDRRMTPARYPDSGFLKISDVADVGDVAEFPPQNYYRDWDSRRNHRGGTYILDADTNERAKGWAEPEKAWMFGYFFWDWADSSTPVKRLDTDVRCVEPAYVSRYGCRRGADYYFFNILEELDSPGEWYLDRGTGMLYMYPTADLNTASVCLSVTTDSIIDAADCRYITFEGFTLQCTRSDAIKISGSHNTVRNCKIKNISGNAVNISGHDNTVTGCEISHTGRGGIMLRGGDRETLTPGRNIADNNLIHDWSEVYLTYQPAVGLWGVGNICSHNEIYNSPQLAVTYGGNDHLIEYNLIHDVVLQSTDGGAIYAGYDWTAQGNIIRYNCLYNIGRGEHRPDGIYWDDALSGQTAYGNVLVNVAKNAFLIGGGRDNSVSGNLIINAGDSAVSYDDRARDGLLHNGWAKNCINNRRTSPLWVRLDAMPCRSDVWAQRYPSLARLTDDFSDHNNPDFPANPSNVHVTGNVILDDEAKIGNIADSVYKYGEIDGNALFTLDRGDLFADAENGDYRLAGDSEIRRMLPGFADIPFGEIGRK